MDTVMHNMLADDGADHKPDPGDIADKLYKRALAQGLSEEHARMIAGAAELGIQSGDRLLERGLAELFEREAEYMDEDEPLDDFDLGPDLDGEVYDDIPFRALELGPAGPDEWYDDDMLGFVVKGVKIG